MKIICYVLENLKTNKTPGPNQISPRILKEAKNEIVKPLCIIFNKSISTGKVSRDWKLVNVTLIFKKKVINLTPVNIVQLV